MATFAVTGTGTPLGERVVAGLGGREAVVALVPGRPVALDGAGCLVSLAVGPGPSPAAGGAAERLAELRGALGPADAAGLPRVVHLSSAVVYGAAPGNAVPLAEDAPVRPDPRFDWAVELAEAERLVAEWRDGAPGRAAAVLRPALVVAPGDAGLARALGGLSGPRTAGDSRPVQFVHIDDVAAAVVATATATEPVDGPLNVAPEGWVGDDQAGTLAGAALPPPALPAPLVGPVRRPSSALGRGAPPPGAEAYASYPWVVSADRLRARGWAPTHSSEEAVVATTSCTPLARLSPRRRQELLLVLATGALAAALATAWIAVSRTVRDLRR